MNEQQLASLHALAQERQAAVVALNSRIHSMVEAVAVAFTISPSEITGRDKHKSVSEARQVVCYVARTCTPMSYPELGKALGLDQSSVRTATKRVEARRAHDRWTNSVCVVLLQQFGTIEEARAQ
jgi:chromosomal replication initiation ATPase DnaA